MKLRTSNSVGTFIGSIGRKAHENVGNSGRGHSQGVPKIFRALICRAHCAVIFAIAQLSCLLLFFIIITYACFLLTGEGGEAVPADRQDVTCQVGRGVGRYSDWIRFHMALHQLPGRHGSTCPRLN